MFQLTRKIILFFVLTVSALSQGLYGPDSLFFQGHFIFMGDTTDGHVELHFDSSDVWVSDFAAWIDSVRTGSFGGGTVRDSLTIYLHPDEFYFDDTDSTWHVRQAGLDSLGEFAFHKIGRGLYDNGDSIQVRLQTSPGITRRLDGIGLDSTDPRNYNYSVPNNHGSIYPSEYLYFTTNGRGIVFKDKSGNNKMPFYVDDGKDTLIVGHSTGLDLILRARDVIIFEDSTSGIDYYDLDNIPSAIALADSEAVLEGFLDHDDLQGVDANEHIDWTIDQGATNIHAGNYNDTQLSQEEVEDYVGGMLDGPETLISVTYSDLNGNIQFIVDDDLSLYDNTTSAFLTSADMSDYMLKAAHIDSFNANITDSDQAWQTSSTISTGGTISTDRYLRLDENNYSLVGVRPGGSTIEMIKVNALDEIQIGTSAIPTRMYSSYFHAPDSTCGIKYNHLSNIPASFTPSSHVHSATDITSGTLSTDRYSAYTDLGAESKIGTGAAQVAAGDHNHSGTYLESESDPVFSAHAASGITSTNITNWNTAYGWGNHASAGYLTSETGDISSVSAGNGLTGGGTSGAVTVTLGTPSSITATSTNSVTSTSHTHYISGLTTSEFADQGVDQWINDAGYGYITGITAGAGMSGGGTSGNVTLTSKYANQTNTDAYVDDLTMDTGSHGIITGPGNAYGLIFQNADNTGYTQISGGTNWRKGGNIWIYPIDHATYPGRFRVYYGGYDSPVSNEAFTIYHWTESSGENRVFEAREDENIYIDNDLRVGGTLNVIGDANITGDLDADEISGKWRGYDIDISSYTNLTASQPIVLSGDNLIFRYEPTEFAIDGEGYMYIKSGAVKWAQLADAVKNNIANPQYTDAVHVHKDTLTATGLTFVSWALPENAVLYDIKLYVQTAFNNGITEIEIGIPGDNDYFANNLGYTAGWKSISTTTVPFIDTYLGETVTTRYNYSGTQPSTGAAWVWYYYHF